MKRKEEARAIDSKNIIFISLLTLLVTGYVIFYLSAGPGKFMSLFTGLIERLHATLHF